MQINELTQELASGYFQLTGRPLATMSVDEYLTFRNQAKNEIEYYSSNYDLNNKIGHSVNNDKSNRENIISTDTELEVENSKDKYEEHQKKLEFKKADAEKIVSYDTKTNNEKKVQIEAENGNFSKQNVKKDKKATSLKLLQSVKG